MVFSEAGGERPACVRRVRARVVCSGRVRLGGKWVVRGLKPGKVVLAVEDWWGWGCCCWLLLAGAPKMLLLPVLVLGLFCWVLPKRPLPPPAVFVFEVLADSEPPEGALEVGLLNSDAPVVVFEVLVLLPKMLEAAPETLLPKTELIVVAVCGSML